MAAMKAFVERNPLSTFYTLVFAVSWGGILLVIGGPAEIPAPAAEGERLFPLVYLAMLAGPILAAILLTGLLGGRAGLHEYLARLFRWRVGGRWYAVALLTAPLAVLGTLLPLSLSFREFLPGIFATGGKASLLLSGVAVGLGAGFEELGWTGFATPALRRRHSVLATGLVVGVLWGAWHFLVTLWGSGTPSGALSLELFLPALVFYAAVLPVFRVLMVWVYDRTESLLVGMLMHASLTASVPFILMPNVNGVQLIAWYGLLTAALWVVVGAVAIANGGRLSRLPGAAPVAAAPAAPALAGTGGQ